MEPPLVWIWRRMLLTSSPTLIATSPSGDTEGSTSNLSPTSTYCTVSATKPVDVEVEVMLGTRCPTWILAFSWLRERMRGLASTFTSARVSLACSVTVGTVVVMVEPRRWRKSLSVSTPLALAIGANATWDGYCTPICSSRERLISRISTSSITSASGWSCSATSFSAMRIASAESRIKIMFCFSSTTTSLALRIVFRLLATALASAEDKKNERTVSCWYSRTLAGLLG